MAITPRVIGHIGVLGLLCFLIYFISKGIPHKPEQWSAIALLCLPLFHFFPVKFNRGSILNARSIGHIGVLGLLCFLIYMFSDRVPNKMSFWIFTICVVLSSFHFFPVKSTEDDVEPSLLGLWITSKKMKFRKQIKEGGGDSSNSDSLFGLWVKSRKIKLSNQIKEENDE